MSPGRLLLRSYGKQSVAYTTSEDRDGVPGWRVRDIHESESDIGSPECWSWRLEMKVSMAYMSRSEGHNQRRCCGEGYVEDDILNRIWCRRFGAQRAKANLTIHYAL